jgi:hypothetical protein
MIFIATIVLKVVGAHNAPCRKVMRNNHEQQSTFPIDNKANDFHAQAPKQFPTSIDETKPDYLFAFYWQNEVPLSKYRPIG